MSGGAGAVPSRFVGGYHRRANGIRQHLLRYGGAGTPLLLVPGITSPAITWGFVAERLADRFDVHVLDVRGRGLSEAGAHLDYGLDAMADDVRALVEASGWADAIVLGHSMGARIAIRAAARGAAGVARLVLVDPPVTGPGRRAYPAPLAWYVDSIRLAQAGTDAAGMRAFCPTWTPEQLALRAEWLHTCDERAVVVAYEGFHADDVHADLRGLAVPARLVVAGRGGVILPADVAELRALAPALEVVEVPGAGHMIPWDDEAGFHRAIDDFLGAHGRAAA